MTHPNSTPHGRMSFGNVLFNPNGRITQSQYWGGVAVVFVGNVLVNFIPVAGLLLWAALVYVGLCVYGKRLHDMGKSAWVHGIVWLVVLIIAIGAIYMSRDVFPILSEIAEQGRQPTEEDVMAMVPQFMPIALAYLINLLIWLAYTIWLGSTASQKADNRFGEGPDGGAFT